MSRTEHVRLMARYNEWMNAKVYETASTLSPAERAADKGAFFKSILGTLNHLMVADTIWLKRFAAHPSQPAELQPLRETPLPVSLDQILHSDFATLHERRRELDRIILAWAQSLTEADLDHVLHYANTKGVVSDRDFFGLVMHFFNHQTHHRGQATTLLSQAGRDVGATDLVVLVPNLAAGG